MTRRSEPPMVALPFELEEYSREQLLELAQVANQLRPGVFVYLIPPEGSPDEW
jgi:hypothetical protein